MSLLFCDSFDHYSSLPQKWSIVSLSFGQPTIVSANARTGANCAHFLGTGLLRQNVGNQTTIIMGGAFMPPSDGSAAAGCTLMATYDVLNAQVDLRWNPSGTIFFTANGTTIGSTSGVVIHNGVYQYIEMKIVFGTGTSGSCVAYVNGASVLTVSSVNTAPSGNAYCNGAQYGSSINSWGAGNGLNVDDVYVCNASGSFNNAALGDTKVLCVMPSANGTLNNYTNVFASYVNGTAYVLGQELKDSNNNVQKCTTAGTATTATPTWSTTGGGTTSVGGGCVFTCVGTGSNPGAANWMAVSEIPPDDNNGYVTDATVSDQDRYTYPAIVGSSVHAVAVNLRAEKDDAAVRSIRAVTKSGGTVADNGSDFTLGLSTYTDFQGIFETDPNTGVAWTVSGVNAAEFGVKTTA